jgi:hypothetical protein
MSFEQLLAGYIGRSVEVFLSNAFYAGRLLSVGTGLFTVEVSDATYYAPVEQVTVFADQVSFVRILA